MSCLPISPKATPKAAALRRARWVKPSDVSFSLMAPADIRALAAWRGAPAPNSCVVCGVLQSGPHTPGITERCANCIDRSNGLAPLSPFPF